jgi:hypothetical protein
VHLHRHQFVSLGWQRRDADVRAGLHLVDRRRDDEYKAGLGIEVERLLLPCARAHIQARAIGAAPSMVARTATGTFWAKADDATV